MKTSLARSVFGALALAALLVAPLGCAGVDENGEVVGEAAAALNTPNLVASPVSLGFRTITHGSSSTATVTLFNTGDGAATHITLTLPPDPYIAAHNPPGDLAADHSSNAMQIEFAPTTAGTFTRTLTVTYYDSTGAGTMHTLSIPVTGTAN